MSSLRQRRVTRREWVVDDYHGVKVADPYRWLEDDESPEVKQWVAEQNGDFENWINGYDIRAQLKSRYTELWNYAKSGVPRLIEGFYYTWLNDGLKNQSILYRSPNPCEAGEQVFDPNPLSEKGTVAVMTQSFSPKGNYLAYGLARDGSDWQIIKVLDLKTLKDLPDLMEHMKFSEITWLPDESGFFYTRFPDPKATILTASARNAMVCLHTLGQDQSEDKVIHKNAEHPDWNFSFSADADKKWAFLSVTYSTLRRNQLYFKPLDKPDSAWLPISPDFDGGYSVIGVVDDVVYISTQKYAPCGSVISLKLSESGASERKTVIPDQGEMLEYVHIANNHLLCTVVRHAVHHLRLHKLNGDFVREIELPARGSISEVSARQKGKEFFVHFSSFLYPDAILRYDFETEKLSTCFASKVNFPFEDYETVQEFYTSKDGTRVPMFITRRKGLAKDGSHPTVLYGYGGYNINRLSSFSPQILAWLEKGGIQAEPCIRGGAEYGEAWHRAGMLESKQNCFDDFIAAAEYLISEKYTVKEKLGIMGRSNGGLLTGACMTQRPDLFGAVLVWVPVLDMLRFQHYTAGPGWVGEFGSAENPEQFKVLHKYSPLHNVKMNTVYPPTLIMTADTDDRVVPFWARKFTAAMQAADAGDNPILHRVEKAAGHGHGKPIGKQIDEQTDLYSFFLISLCGAK